MKKLPDGFVAGFIGGLLFAVVHVAINFRYNLPFYLAQITIERFIVCTGRSCLYYLIAAALISSLFWGFVGVLIHKLIQADEANSA